MQEQAKNRNNITIDNVIAELEEARQIAKQSGNAAAMVSATLGKAKLLGLDKKAGVNENPMTAFIASLQGSFVQVVQHCDDD